jgi:hypothetical protein
MLFKFLDADPSTSIRPTGFYSAIKKVTENLSVLNWIHRRKVYDSQ